MLKYNINGLYIALHRCARNDNIQGCKILLSYNVDTSITSVQGFKAIDVATDNVKKILQGIFTMIVFEYYFYLFCLIKQKNFQNLLQF